MEKVLPAIQADWRERKFERNRVDILEAAARAFARKGPTGATMADIAAEAGYTVPTLYSYFKSKDDIVHGLMLMLHREFLSPFEEPPASGLSFAQNLELLIRRALELAERKLLPAAAGEAPGEMVLNWSFLVPRSGVKAFLAEVEQQGGELAERGLVLQTAGPFPPFSFTPGLDEPRP